MWTSLLIAVSCLGTDPDVVFGGDGLNAEILSVSEQSRGPISDPTSRSQLETTTTSSKTFIGNAIRVNFADQRLPRRQPISSNTDWGRLRCIDPFRESAERMIPKEMVESAELSGNKSAVRGQTVSEASQPQGDVSGFFTRSVNSFWNEPYIQQLITEINPFAPLSFQILTNYYDPFGSQMGTSSWGRQGYRLGWTTFNENALLPSAHTSGATGSMKFFEWNSNAKYSRVIQPGLLFNGTFWFSAHWWDGPSGIALPGQVDQVSSDLELGFFGDGPWSGQIGFHPQIVNTYEARIDRNAFNFDGKAVTTYQASPEWSFVGGVAIWNRVDTLIVPTVGAIWTPNGRWEIRALFPKSLVCYFLGNWRNADFWLYGQYEYKAESWQTTIGSVSEYSDRIQITDQRLTAGLRWDSGRYSFYTEAGYVFARQAKFANATPSFDLGDTSILTFGLRY